MYELKEAGYYKKLNDAKVTCTLCPHNCIILKGKNGICGTRKNIDGTLYSDIYGRLTAVAMDPIEKKPLYHFFPGEQILSIGTRGCNFKCPFCQNWHISQDLSATTSYHSPEEVVQLAINNNSVGIAYTYSEPMIWAEYVLDTAKIAQNNNLKNVMVTNGFVNDEPLNDLLQVIDAMNIDLKSFREDTYKQIVKGNLENVLNTIKTVYRSGCHIELTTLIVTGINDSKEEMKDIINFIASIDRNIPWHISRYHPSYKYNEPATDIDFMMETYSEAVKKLNFVYSGNISSKYNGSDTFCPSCNLKVISRSGYYTRKVNLSQGTCAKCGTDLNIHNP